MNLYFLLLTCVTAAPFLASPAPVHLPIFQQRSSSGNSDPLHVAQLQLETLFSKYAGGNNDDGSASGKRKRQGGLQIFNYRNTMYYSTISLGNPSVPFNLVVDTGSSDLIVGTSCSEHGDCTCTGCFPETPLYVPADSITAKVSNTPFSIKYGTGNASGYLVTDQITFGDPNSSDHEPFSKVSTIAACSQMTDIVTSSISGILGMAWKSLAQGGRSFIQELWEDGFFNEPVFGIGFGIIKGDDEDIGGVLTLGGINESLTSEIQYIALDPLPTSKAKLAGHWAVPLNDVVVSVNQSSKALNMSSPSVLIDTGTTLVGLPASIARSIWSQVPQAHQLTDSFYAYPCQTELELGFQFGDEVYWIGSRDLNAGRVGSLGFNQEVLGDYCLGSLFAFPEGSTMQDYWVLGDAFLRNVYTAFRFEPPSVGFGKLKQITLSSWGDRGYIGGPGAVSPAKRTTSKASTCRLNWFVMCSILLAFAL